MTSYARPCFASVQLLLAFSFCVVSALNTSSANNQVKEGLRVAREVNLSSTDYESLKLLCIVQTTSYNDTKAVRTTWAKHCDDSLFVGQHGDILKNENVHRPGSVKTFCEIITNAYFLKDFDWVILTDDLVFVVVHHLKLFLSKLSNDQPVYSGRAKILNNVVYPTIKAGIVLNQPAVAFLSKAKSICPFSHQTSEIKDDSDDHFELTLSREMERSGYSLTRSDDEHGKARFHDSLPQYYYQTNATCCSDTAVTFRSNNALDTQILNYWIYYVIVHNEFSYGVYEAV